LLRGNGETHKKKKALCGLYIGIQDLNTKTYVFRTLFLTAFRQLSYNDAIITIS
jgi:uncharacterized membrane protein YiaA